MSATVAVANGGPVRRCARTAVIARVALACVASACVASALAAQQAPQATVTIKPERVTVGDPVVVTARVSAPIGAVIEFPSVVNAGESIEALDPRVVHVRTGGNEVVAEATWRVVAWDTGAHALPIADASVTTGGALTHIPLPTMMLTVESVLPADTSRRTPKPPRDVVAIDPPWWDTWSPLLVPLLVLLLGWAIWKRNRKERPAPPTARREADRAFERLESGSLGAVGEPAREVAIATEIVRDFLAARYAGAEVSLTTAELLALLPLRSTDVRHALGELLAFADLVKYARRAVNAREAADFTARAHALLGRIAATDGDGG